MNDWRKEFQYLLDRKILSRDELGYLFGQIKSIVDRENEQLQAELEQHRWIPVSERLPERRIKVLTIGATSESDISEPAVAWIGEQGEWYAYANVSGFYAPTHWKPIILPEQALKETNEEPH